MAYNVYDPLGKLRFLFEGSDDQELEELMAGYLDAGKSHHRHFAILALGLMKTPRVEELLEPIARWEGRDGLLAASALVQRGDEAMLEQVHRHLGAQDRSLAEEALDIVSRLGRCASVDPLVTYLDSAGPYQHHVAQTALERIVMSAGCDVTSGQLAGLVEHDFAYIRLLGIRLLGEIGGDASLLLDARYDTAPQVRLACLEALLRVLPAEETVPYLVELMEDEDALVRLGAIEALVDTQDAAAVALLEMYARLPDDGLSEAASRALGK